MKSAVIGQTGRTVLSDDLVKYKQSQKRTVRYQYAKMQHGWNAWVCGPFHSRTYGACSFGTNKARAKAALKRRLADNYNYIGHLMFSDVDDADNVGIVNDRLLDENTQPAPITFTDASM